MLKQKVHTLITNPLDVLEKYRDKLIIRLTRRLPPLCNENYDKHWNYLSFKGKDILDLGADYGSTASYFLYRGARHVIAVEGDKKLAEQLRKNFQNNSKVTPIELFIKSPEDIDKLISKYTPDVVKVDIEGYELNLLECKNIQRVKEWLIECHNQEICEEIESIFLREGFDVAIIEYGEMINLSLPISVLITVKPFSCTDVTMPKPERAVFILNSKSSNKCIRP